MPKVPGTVEPSQINSPVETDLTAVLKAPKANLLAQKDTFIFRPTDSMARLKARFWERYQPGPLSGAITPMKIASVTDSQIIHNWWKDTGFREWFLNKDEEREKIRFLFNKSLDCLYHIIDNPNMAPQSQLTAIRLLAELSGTLGKQKEVKYADEEINKMDTAQLEAFLAKKGVKVVNETVVEVSDAGKTKNK